MSTRRLVVALTFLAVFAMAARVSVDTDTWWHLRTGQWILENGSIPQLDPFSYTRGGQPWKGASVNWVSDVGLYFIYASFGLGGLNILQALVVTLAFFFVYRTLSGGVFLKAFVIVLAAAASGLYWAARPYLMTFLLSAVTFWILEDFRWRRADRLWLLPLLMLLWSNSHGGFATGFILWAVYAAGEFVAWLVEARHACEFRFTKDWLDRGFWGRLGRMLLIGLLMAAGASINFSGPSILLYPFETLSIGTLGQFIQEWQSPDFHDLQVQPFAWLLLLTIATLGASKRRMVFTDFLLVAGFAFLGLTAARNVALFALVAPAVLARHAAPLLEELREKLGIRLFAEEDGRGSRWQSRLNLVLFGVLVLAVGVRVASVLPEAVNLEIVGEQVPLDAVEFLKTEALEGNLFNSYNWGGYLVWALPEYPVFVDGRTDLYGDDLIGQWLRVVRAEDGWQAVLEGWDVHLILLEPGWPVVPRLSEEGWQLLYQDELAVVYVR